MRQRPHKVARALVMLMLGSLLAAMVATAHTPAYAASGDCININGSVTCTYTYTGAAQTWTVPTGASSATFDLYGAQGGSGPFDTAIGGSGGRATVSLNVTPGTVYQIRVGGRGGSVRFGQDPPGAGGFNGGGSGGSGFLTAGGGGASDIRTGSFALADRIIVAGGGGAAPYGFAFGGSGGGNTGGDGRGGRDGNNSGGGKGGSQTTGGDGGIGDGQGGLTGNPGSLGTGGNGADHTNDGGAGAGGGGGYYGGGGGGGYYGGGGGGGGGSGYGPAGVVFQTGVRGGDGQVIITYTLPNRIPSAVNDSYFTNEDTTLTVNAPGVLQNDSDADSTSLTAIKVSNPAHGTVMFNANGSFTYTPAANYNGPDSFSYKVNDGVTDSNTATVNLTVNAVNDAPTATGDSYSTDENATLTINAPGVLANDSDADSTSLTAVKVSNPTHGTLTLNANGSFTYAPTTGYSGPDSFSYKANDGAADSNVATVNITVVEVNDAPSATNDSYSTNEDTTLTVGAPGVLQNDSDPDGDTLTAVKVSDPAHGTVTLNSNGSFTYTPAANYNGTDSFSYKANDGAADSNEATVNLTVLAVNDAPVAGADSYTAVQNTPLSVPAASGLLANDSDLEGDSLQVTAATNPAHGSLSWSANGSFTYTPHNNYNGPDSFTYTLSDGTNSVQGQVTLTVRPPNATGAQFYAVDNNLDNGTSQLYTIDPTTGVATALGPRQQFDFEDVAVQPGSGTLYAATGGDGTQKGLVSIVDGQTGILSPLAPSGLPRINALSFKSDGTLWVWVEGKGLYQLNPSSGTPLSSTPVYKTSKKIEGMAWAADGNLYLARDKYLYQFNPTTKKWKEYAKNLPRGTESLSILPDGRLVGGTRAKTNVSLFTYNITTKQVVSTKTLTGVAGFTFTSVEGLAWPSGQSLPTGF